VQTVFAKFMNLKRWMVLIAMAIAPLCLGGTSVKAKEIFVRPSKTDAAITQADEPHLVAYNPQSMSDRLLVFLPGTGGAPEWMPLFGMAAEQGYRVISLSYRNMPAVAQVCIGSGDQLCAQKFRQKRIFGNNVTPAIADTPADSIVNRLTKLLRYLSAADKTGRWGEYLGGGEPLWSRVTVAGQSQGGGMAAFLAKKHAVARVIIFSGGWDNRGQWGPVRPADIAAWYSAPSVTPASLWYGTYHDQEENAAAIAQTYAALKIPRSHVIVFRRPVPPGKAHGFGVYNPANAREWRTLLGEGHSD
jgi:hypothetical protein